MKKGFTLLEAVIAMAIIAVSVASSLVIMGKLASMTSTKGDIMGILTASAVAQYTVDEVRDINFPPLKTMETLTYTGGDPAEDYPANADYSFRRRITTYDGHTVDDGAGGPTYSGGSDNFSNSAWNLLKTEVTVYKNDKPLMTTYTYKVRNGQF